MVTAQQDLFGVADDRFPEGFRYSPGVAPLDLQRSVLEAIPALPFKAFDFHGFEGKRRTVSFGWKYDFDSQSIRKTETPNEGIAGHQSCTAKACRVCHHG